MDKLKHFFTLFAMTIFLNLNSVCCDDIRLQNCADKKLYSLSSDKPTQVLAELGSKIDHLAKADNRILVYRMKHNETKCVYLAADHDEVFFQKYMRRYQSGYVTFAHVNHKVEIYKVIYQIEEGDFCLEYKVTHMKNLIEKSTNLYLQKCKEIVEDETKEIYKLGKKINQSKEAEKKICVFEFKNENFTLPFLHRTQCIYVARLFDEQVFKDYMRKIYIDYYCKQLARDFVPIGKNAYDSFPVSIDYKEGVVTMDAVNYIVIYTEEEGSRCKENVVKMLQKN